MGQNLTRQSLLCRVRDTSDHASWREFDEVYRDLILGYCRRRGLQQSDAEDVRQMVMLSLAKRLRSFEYRPGRGRFRDYLGMSVTNAIRRYFRRPRLETTSIESGLIPEPESGAEEQVDREWEEEWMLHHYRLAMRSVRKTADPRSVKIFERLLDGQSPQQIAGEIGASQDAVEKVKQRMRMRMRDLVTQQIRDENMVGPDPEG